MSFRVKKRITEKMEINMESVLTKTDLKDETSFNERACLIVKGILKEYK